MLQCIYDQMQISGTAQRTVTGKKKKMTKSLKKGCREFVLTFREAILNCLTCHCLFEIHSSSLCASVYECACACVRVQTTVDVSGQVLSVKVLSTSTT